MTTQRPEERPDGDRPESGEPGGYWPFGDAEAPGAEGADQSGRPDEPTQPVPDDPRPEPASETPPEPQREPGRKYATYPMTPGPEAQTAQPRPSAQPPAQAPAQPSTQFPPQQPPAAYGAAGPHQAHRQPQARVPGWLWPVVAGLALVVGLFGGAIGGIGWTAWEGWVQGTGIPGSSSGRASGGLDSVDTTSEPPLPADNGSIAAVAEEVLPSTVQITAEYDGDERGSTGSGFVLDRQGHVITNNHVVEQAAKSSGPIRILDQNGKVHDAKVVGRSAVYDLAVLHARSLRSLPPAALGSSQVLRVGDGVVAIGSPLGLNATVTAGIVSSLNRPVTTGSDDLTSYINAVQTDAAINPGNSGGPLVDLRARVVGVNSAIATTDGLGSSGNIGVGFAIPVEQVKITADQILRTGEARYPVIGAKVDTGAQGGETGALIGEILPDAPALDAGLEAGDVVIAIDGHRVTDAIELIVAIRTHEPGQVVELTYLRDGIEHTTKVTLGSEVG